MAQIIRRVIPDGDYATRLSALYTASMAAAEDEKKNPPTLYADEIPRSEQLATEHAELLRKAEADAKKKRRVVVLRGLGRAKWRELKAAHPMRVGDEFEADVKKGDRLAGVNTETVEDDLVFASISEPKFKDRADYDQWANEDISEGEFQMLLRDAWSLVNVAQVDPLSLPPSQIRSNGGN